MTDSNHEKLRNIYTPLIYENLNKHDHKTLLHVFRSDIHETVEAQQLKDFDKFAFYAIFEWKIGIRLPHINVR